MSKRLLVLFVLSVAIVALSGLSLADPSFEIEPLKTTWDPPAENRPPGSGDPGLGFGKKIAGAWLGTGEWAFDFDCDGLADTDPTPFPYDSQSFTASGLYIVTNPTDPNLAHGSWKQTGNLEVTTNNIVYFNNTDVPPAPGEAPVLAYVMRIPGVFTFDAEFTTATSTYQGIGYFATQDPLDPTEPPLWCTVGSHSSLRKVLVNP
jgi:hypothetical protein